MNSPTSVQQTVNGRRNCLSERRLRLCAAICCRTTPPSRHQRHAAHRFLYGISDRPAKACSHPILFQHLPSQFKSHLEISCLECSCPGHSPVWMWRYRQGHANSAAVQPAVAAGAFARARGRSAASCSPLFHFRLLALFFGLSLKWSH